MKKLLIFIAIMVSACSLQAQDASYTLFKFDSFIPKVTVDDQNYDFQQSVTPNIYKDRPVIQDMRWLKANDSLMLAFWNEKGDSLLHILSELSGIDWIEPSFNIYFLRFYPSLGSSNPMVIPLGGIDNGSFTVAVPENYRQQFNLIYQLSLRMLAQAELNGQNQDMYYIAHHPLMQPSQFRRDVLAMLLAVNASYISLGFDSTENSERSLYWKNNFPGYRLYAEHLKAKWFLSTEKTLTDYLLNEPYNSSLVKATRPPKNNTETVVQVNDMYIEDLPLKGELGFSVKFNDAGQLQVYKIDENKLAYQAGLREGDVIRKVDGRLVRNQKTMVEYMLNGLEKSGAVVEVYRAPNVIEFLFQPLQTESFPGVNVQPVEDSLPPTLPDIEN